MNKISSNISNTYVKKVSFWALVITAVLMVPFVTKAPWTLSDYIFSGIVLSMCALTYEFLTRSMTRTKHRVLVGLGVVFFIFLVIGWAASGP